MSTRSIMTTALLIAGAGIAALAFACGVTTAANAQLVTAKQISLPMAITIATTAVETCKAQGYNVSVHVIGNMGEVLVALRGDNTGPHTMENSMRKALTSRGQRIPSGQFAENVAKTPNAGGLRLGNSIPVSRDSAPYQRKPSVRLPSSSCAWRSVPTRLASTPANGKSG